MPTPNEYAIVANLQTALRAIHVNTGYYYTMQSVAVKLDPNVKVESLIAPGGHRPVIVLAVQPDEWEYSPAKRATVTLPVDIHWFNDSDPTDDANLMLTFFKGCADVEKALAIDVSRGGLAIDTRITSRTAIRHNESSVAWAVVSARMQTRRVYGVPSA